MMRVIRHGMAAAGRYLVLPRDDPRRARRPRPAAERARRGPGERARRRARADLGRACTSTRWRCSCSSRPAARSTRDRVLDHLAAAAATSSRWRSRPTVSRLAQPVYGTASTISTSSLRAVRRLVGDRVALGVADDRGAERALRGVHLDALGGVLHLAGPEQEGLDLVVGVAGELVGHLHPGLDDTVVRGRLADLGAVAACPRAGGCGPRSCPAPRGRRGSRRSPGGRPPRARR